MILVGHTEDIIPSHSAKDPHHCHCGQSRKRAAGMAAIPQSYMMAKSRKKAAKTKEDQYIDAKNQPLCYSNKMMNSIWGQYNKYSVHNLKAVQNDAEVMFNEPVQQMLQGNPQEGSLNLPDTQRALHRDFGGYAGDHLKQLVNPVLMNGLEFLKH